MYMSLVFLLLFIIFFVENRMANKPYFLCEWLSLNTFWATIQNIVFSLHYTCSAKDTTLIISKSFLNISLPDYTVFSSNSPSDIWESEISQAVRDKYHTISPLTTDILETIILFRGGLCFALSGVEQLWPTVYQQCPFLTTGHPKASVALVESCSGEEMLSVRGGGDWVWDPRRAESLKWMQ